MTHRKKKCWRKYPKHESDENNGREKETMVRWVESQRRKEKNEVMAGKGKDRQGWRVGEGATDTEGGVSGRKRKERSSTEEVEEEGRGKKGRDSSKVTSREICSRRATRSQQR
jgi:hypothetical protein